MKNNPFLTILADLMQDNSIHKKYEYLDLERGITKADGRDIVKSVFAEYDMNVGLRTVLWLQNSPVNYIPAFDFDSNEIDNDHYLVCIAGISGANSLMPILVLKQNNSDNLIIIKNGESYFLSKYRFFYEFNIETIETFCIIDENKNSTICMFHRELIATLLPHQLQE